MALCRQVRFCYDLTTMRKPASLLLVILCFLLSIPQSIFAESLSVTAVVPANATNFSADLTSDQTSAVGQNHVITYTLDYSSTLSTDPEIALEVDWSRGTIQGSGAQVDVLTYVPGSATTASGSTPVIDTINRKITWDIAALPGNTPQQVTFQLKTSGTLTSSENVTYTVSGENRRARLYDNA